MKRIGKNPKSQLQHKADIALQKFIVAKNPKCECCGQATYCGHHLVEKARSNALRYVEENIIPVCLNCHTKIHNRIFGRPTNQSLASYHILNDIIKRKGGIKWLDDLERRGRELVKTDMSFYQSALDLYTQKLNDLS